MKALALIFCSALLFACNPSNNNPGESGAVNDGIKAVDQNGALPDTATQNNPQTDTAKGEDRVDVQPRQ